MVRLTSWLGPTQELYHLKSITWLLNVGWQATPPPPLPSTTHTFGGHLEWKEKFNCIYCLSGMLKGEGGSLGITSDLGTFRKRKLG